MDEDLDPISPEQVLAQARRLRKDIGSPRDSRGHQLCWHDPDLRALLPDRLEADEIQASVMVPAWPQLMRGCLRYGQSIDEQAPEAPRTQEEWRAT